MIELDSHINQLDTALGDESSLQGRTAAHDLNLIDIATQLTYHKWLIAKVTGIAALVGVVTSLLLPVRYEATTRIMTPQPTQSSATAIVNQLAGSAANSLTASAAGGLSLRNPNDIYIGLLRSRPIADAIIGQFDLAKLYRAPNATVAREKLTANTSISSEKSGLLAISVTDGDKNRASQIANAYTRELSILTKTLAMTEASQRRLFYEEQLKHAKDDLIVAELSFQQIQQKKGLVQLDAQAKATIEGLTNLHAAVAAKQVELQALRSYSTERNPSVALTENQLSTLEAETARLEERNRSSNPADMGLQDFAGAGLDYLRAQHELQYRQAMLDSLLKQYDAARLDEAKEATVIQVVEAASPPDRKSEPHRSAVVLAFMALGLLGVCLYLLICDFAKRSPNFSQSLAAFKQAVVSR